MSETTIPTFRPFTSLCANVKKEFDNIPLRALTCIAGEEASYKSAIGIAIRLALTGEYHPVGKLPSSLLRLAEDPLVGIQTTLQGPDGTAEWRLEVKPNTGKAMRPQPPVFEGKLSSLTEDEKYCIIPSDSVRDLLSNAKGERKLREAILRRFGGDQKSMPEPFALSEYEQGLWDDMVNECKKQLDDDVTADLLLASLSEAFRLSSGRLSREIKPLSKSILERRRALAEDGSGSEILDELKEQLQGAQDFEAATTVRAEKEALERRISETQKELEGSESQLRAELERAKQEEAEYETDLKNAEELEELRLADKIAAVSMVSSDEGNAAVFFALAERGETKCPYCPYHHPSPEYLKKTGEDLSTRAERRRKQKEALDVAYQKAKDATAQARAQLSEKEREVIALDAQLAALRQHIEKEKRTLLKSLTEYIERLKDAPTSYSGQSVEALQERIVRIEQALEAKRGLEQEGQRLRELEREYDALKKLEKESETLQERVMKHIAKTASEEVSRGMSGGRRASLDPKSCEWAVIGKDGQPHDFDTLCRTEQTSLMLGMVRAWTRGAPLRVAIFDDDDMVGLSRKGMQDFFAACKDAVETGDLTQVIVIWNRPDEVPEGWHLIRSDAVAQAPQ